MSKILGWILTPLALIALWITLLVWHPFIVLFYRVNRDLFYKFVALGNGVLILDLKLVGANVTVSGRENLPQNEKVVIVSNHQSYFDIPLFIWIFRQYQPSFVAKHTLGRFFPSVSFVLRKSGSALINRKIPREALPSIEKMAEIANNEGRSVCIFPEGTRARDGELKRFKRPGLIKLLEKTPDYKVLPVYISGAWKLMKYNMAPIPFGVDIHVKILEPICRTGISDDEVASLCEKRISSYAKDLTTEPKAV